jgi:hypothetical protein
VDNLTESRLLGVSTSSGERSASFSLRTTDGVLVTLKAIELERMLVSEMREQNIIDEVIEWTGKRIDPSVLASLFFLLANTDEQNCNPVLAETVRETYAKVSRGELILLEISAVYGAQVLALCQTVERQEEKI